MSKKKRTREAERDEILTSFEEKATNLWKKYDKKLKKLNYDRLEIEKLLGDILDNL